MREVHKQVVKLIDLQTWASSEPIRSKILMAIGVKVKFSPGSLLMDITLSEHYLKYRSNLLYKIQDGSLLRILEAIVLTDEFRWSVTDVSDLDIEDSSTRQQLEAVLRAVSRTMSLRLSVTLQQLMDLLFNPSCTNVILKLSPAVYKPTALCVDDVFDEVFPVLSEILLKPLNDIDMTEEQSK